VLAEPTVALPKSMLGGITEICGCTPVPVTVIVAGELVAVLVTVTLPEKLLVAVGAKVTLNEADCPAERVSGSPMPVTVNPLPLMVFCEIVTPELPVLVSVTLFVVLVPVVKLPKLSEVGDAVSCRVGETAVPERATPYEEFGELFTSVSVPGKLPAEAGANLMEKAEVPPGGKVSGSVSPERLNPVPVKVAWVMLRFAVPGLLMVQV